MPILVKRYGSRLYDTHAGRYVSVQQLRQWQADGVSFRLIDAASGEEVVLGGAS